MNLILIRHSHAEISYPDELRKLTSFGIEHFNESSAELKNKINNIDLILTSPLKRAVQTGEILSNVFGLHDSFYVEKTLSPGCSSKDIIDLADIYKVQTLACVFHQPDIAYNFHNFCSTNEEKIDFHPGSIAVLKFEQQIQPSKGILKHYIK